MRNNVVSSIVCKSPKQMKKWCVQSALCLFGVGCFQPGLQGAVLMQVPEFDRESPDVFINLHPARLQAAG